MNHDLERFLDAHQNDMVEDLRELLRIPSVDAPGEPGAPFGREIQRAYEWVLALGEKHGFACKDFGQHACELNLLAPQNAAGAVNDEAAEDVAVEITTPHLPGADAVGVVSHLDVVPAGSGWSHEPFGGELSEGVIYGRGAVDDKGPLIASFYACLAIKESGLPIRKTIKHIIGANEETGVFPCIKYYKEHAEVPGCGIVPDSWFPVVFAEKGFLSFRYEAEDASSNGDPSHFELLSATGGEAFNMVAAHATATLRILQEPVGVTLPKGFWHKDRVKIEQRGDLLVITTTGVAAHASTPELGVNAIAILLRVLELFSLKETPITKALIGLSKLVAYDTDGSGLGVAFSDHTGALTSNIGLLSYQDGHLSVGMNQRSPVTFPIDDLTNQLRDEGEKIGLQFRVTHYNPHYYMEPDHPLMQMLTEVYREQTGDLTSQPKAHGGGSYARALEGFVPFGPSIQGEPLSFHKQDESITCERLLLLAKIYAEALYRLAR